jgi:hypothetical protein
MLTQSRAGHIKAGRLFCGHRRLGLYVTEHDGTLFGPGPAFFLLIPLLLARVRSVMLPGITVLFAVGFMPLQHLVRSAELQGPQRARTVVRRNGLRRSHLHLRPGGHRNNARRGSDFQIMPRLVRFPCGMAHPSAIRHGE